MISVIIPVLNEEKILSKNIEYFKKLAKHTQLIFVDGGSLDNTIRTIRGVGCCLIAPRGRASQMNKGSDYAEHEILLFLHVDTLLDIRAISMLEVEMKKNPKLLGGCFTQVICHPNPIYKWIAWTGNVRARIFKIFFGDQGIFVRKSMFVKLSGFPKVNICEDILFTRKLREMGEVAILKHPIVCSARRWQEAGILRTTMTHWKTRWGLDKRRKDEKFFMDTLPEAEHDNPFEGSVS